MSTITRRLLLAASTAFLALAAVGTFASPERKFTVSDQAIAVPSKLPRAEIPSVRGEK